MKNIFIIVTALLFITGCAQADLNENQHLEEADIVQTNFDIEPTDDMEPTETYEITELEMIPIESQDLTLHWQNILKNYCERSGGIFSDNTCSCPSELGVDMYNYDFGTCHTTVGNTGGQIGENEKFCYGNRLRLETCETELESTPITAKDESGVAKQTLLNFFNYLNDSEFVKADNLLSLDWRYDSLDIYSPEEDRNNPSKILENYCKATGSCLPAKILSAKQASNYKYDLTVQFVNKDGSTFVLGPCCGATEEQMPPVDTFDYVVKKIDGQFKVVTPPVYRP